MKKYGNENSSSNFDNMNLINPLLNMFLNNNKRNNEEKKNSNNENKTFEPNNKEYKKAQSQQKDKKDILPVIPFNDIKFYELIEKHDKISARIDRKNNLSKNI